MSSLEQMEQMLNRASFGNSFSSLQSRMDEFNASLKSEMAFRISNMASSAKYASDSLILLAKSNGFDSSRFITYSFMYTPITDQLPKIGLLPKTSLSKQNTVTQKQDTTSAELEEDKEEENNKLKIENAVLKKENAKFKKNLYSEVLHVYDILFSHKDKILELKAELYEFKKFEPLLRLIKDKLEEAGGEL